MNSRHCFQSAFFPIRARYLLLVLFIMGISPLGLYAQNETQEEVVDRINLGVKYLSESKHAVSIEELIGAKETALRNGWYSQAFSATLNIGTNYFMMMDNGEAFRYYSQAYEIAIKHLGKSQEMAVFNNIGVLYIEEKDQAKAKETFLKAYEIAKELADKEKMATYGINLALVLNKMGELATADKYIEEALPLLKGTTNVYLLGKIAKTENLLLSNEYSKAEELALDILPQQNYLTEVFKEGLTANDKITILLLTARIFEKQNRFHLAENYAFMARSEQKDIEGRIDIYGFLSDLYIATNDFGKALAYKDSVIIATDSLYSLKNDALFKSEKVKFQIQNYQHQLSEGEKAFKQEKQFFYQIIIGVILVMGFLIWVYKNNSVKLKQRKKILELELIKEKSDHLLMERQHREKEALALLEKERLKNELDSKNRELTARAMYLASKNELIKEVIQSLSQNDQIAINLPIKSQIADLKKYLKKDTQWDSFFMHFEELNQDFLNRLRVKHPLLNSNDIRFISFLYMNLSYKEIASLLNITPQSCRKRKERLSKKMNVPDNVSFHSYLSTV